MTVIIQPSLAAGELAPSLYGRVDLAKFYIGLSLCRNFFIKAHGGASNRPGLIFVGATKDNQVARNIPFEFNTEQTYALQFTDLAMRVITNGGYVLESDKVITGATQANPVVVTTSAAHGFSNGDDVFISAVAGMTEINGRRFTAANVTATTLELSGEDGTGYTAYSSGGVVARVFTLVTPYVVADIPLLKFTQSADVLTLTHPSYETRELNRLANDNWTLTIVSFQPETDFPTAIVVTPKTAGVEEYRYSVTAVSSETFEESLTGIMASQAITGATQADPVVITSAAHGLSNNDSILIENIVGMTELNDRRFTIANVNPNDYQLFGEDGTGHTAYGSGGTASRTYGVTVLAAVLSATDTIDVDWVGPAADIEKFNVYRQKNGTYGFIGSVDGLAATTFTDDFIDPDLSDTPPKERNPFETVNNYPAVVTFHEQRRTFAQSFLSPDTLWWTRIGAFNNLNISTPSKADDAITATLRAAQVNEIRHLITLKKDLLVFTSGAEWRISASGDVGFTPQSINLGPQSYWGSAQVPPLIVGSSIVMVQKGGAVIRDLGFDFVSDNYTGTELSILSNHLFEGFTIDEWAYAKNPNSIIWCIRNDGVLLGLTYMKEQQVNAWHQHNTKGTFESVCAVQEGNETAIYFVVKRTINGSVVRYTERLHTREFGNEVRDAFFVDSGLSYDNPFSITGVTAANPVVVTTSSAHGFSNGDEIDLFDIESDDEDIPNGDVSMAVALNTKRFVAANVTATTLELTGIDGTSYTAYVEEGTARKAIISIFPLHHLEGEKVVALADGNVITGLTVTDGVVTFARKFSRIHIGLPYIADLQSLNAAIIGKGGGGTIQGKKKSVPEVTLRFEKSRGIFVGPSETKLIEMKQREFEKYGDPTELLTGDKRVALGPNWDTEGRVHVQQPNPLPVSILAFIPEIKIGG